MDKAVKARTKEHFFSLRERLGSLPYAKQEMMTALRRAVVINSTALDCDNIDPIFLQLAPDKIPDRNWERVASDYQNAMLETQALLMVVERLEEIALGKRSLTIPFLLQLNRSLFERTRYSGAGKFREDDGRETLTGRKAPHHSRLSEMLDHHLCWLNHRLIIFNKVSSDNFLEMFHISAEGIYRLADTLAFEHGNGRFGLLVGDYVLLFTGLHYNIIDYTRRDEYLDAVQNSAIDNLAPLVNFLISCFAQTLCRADGLVELAGQKNAQVYRGNLSR